MKFVPEMKQRKELKRKLPIELMNIIQRRNRLWKVYKATQRIVDWENYRKARNYTKSRIREYENTRMINMISEFKGNKKKFYGFVRNQQKSRSGINFVRNKDNNLTTTFEETAEVLNAFYQSVFVVEGDYIAEDKSLVDTELYDIEISEIDVINKLTRLKEDK